MLQTYSTWSSIFIALTNIYKTIGDKNNWDHKGKNIEKWASSYFNKCYLKVYSKQKSMLIV